MIIQKSFSCPFYHFSFFQEIKLCHHHQDFWGRTVSGCLTIIGEICRDCVKVHGMGVGTAVPAPATPGLHPACEDP